MRAYKFLDSTFGLKSLYEKRLKQSRLSDLNDPFELTPFDLTDVNIRESFFKTRHQLGEVNGVVCFSADWENPVIWAHYSDKHKGLCLGFEIPEMKGDPANDESKKVTYIDTPEQFPSNFLDLPDSERFAIVQRILFTKFDDWQYEHEIRVWAPLQNKEGDLYFLECDDNLRLVEVIIGQKCSLSTAKIVQALGSLAKEVKISKARAAYDKFKMVEDEQWLLMTNSML
jgi:hypothetical protein